MKSGVCKITLLQRKLYHRSGRRENAESVRNVILFFYLRALYGEFSIMFGARWGRDSGKGKGEEV
jgi:hypothetical protein